MRKTFAERSETLDQLAIDGYAVIPDALPPAQTEALLQEWRRRYAEGASTPAQIGKGHQKHEAQTIRSDRIHWLDPSDPQPAVAAWFELVRSWSRAVNQGLYLSINAFECHFAVYEAGAFYQKHRDRFQNDNGRRLSLVFFLNKDWQSQDGGELVIYDPEDEDRILKIVSPAFGTLVLFDSQRFPHEVRAPKRQRLSLTGWLKSIPAHEAALNGTGFL
ncbi:MAG TPA: 2OG-Fe(II) oxygenase [Oligoflexus sp.]|uniref:2OG-Fe(II) oxygenase n=1 Tax=Oligoflexus sp. TaxID=1971216 RepID=UPI002D7FCA12|nr:2OG-Fe(II) oxygenase [Oligoflexus sp.]HET9236837.1 2OG-Fe(II) oxygenase [Oligoflexus sp.]